MASSSVDRSSDDATDETAGNRNNVDNYESLRWDTTSNTHLLLGSEEYVERENPCATISSRATEIVAEYKTHCMEVSKVHEEVKEFHRRYSTDMNLQEQYPHCIEKVNGYIRDLQKQELSVVVAGEDGSGKSSLLNLLICQNIFPISQQPCTSAICFLHNSDRRTMDVTYDDHQTESYSANNLQNLQQRMKRVMDQTRNEGQRTCISINIYWPVSVFPRNVVLVEVPGVGENPERDKIVLECISKATVCIYVVLSSQAGGLQKDKLKQTLRHRPYSICREQTTDPFAHTLFVCNHWDKVRANEEEGRVWNNMLKTLKSCTSNLNEDNVVKISVEKAALHLRRKLLEKDDVKCLKELVGHFDRLFKDSLRAKTSHHFGIIATMLLEIHECLTNRRHFADLKEEEKTKELDRIQKELSTIRRQSKEFKTDIRAYMDRELEAIVVRLHEFLHLEETKERLLNCKGEIVPPMRDPSSTKLRALAKLEHVIDDWEDNFKMIDGVRKETQSRVQTFVGHIFKRMEKINLTLDTEYKDARAVLGQYPRIVVRVDEHAKQAEDVDKDTSLPIEWKIIFGVTAPIWIPLAVAAGIVAFSVHAIHQAITAGRYYNNEYQEAMHHQMTTILQSCLTKPNLRAYLLKKVFSTFRKEVESLIDQNVSKSNTAKTRELQIIKQDKRSSEQIRANIEEAKSDLGNIVRRFENIS